MIFYNITPTNSSQHVQFGNPGDGLVDILPPGLTLSSANLLNGDSSNEALAVTDDPSVGGTTDPMEFVVETTFDIPTLGSAGLAASTLLLVAAALTLLGRRRA